MPEDSEGTKDISNYSQTSQKTKGDSQISALRRMDSNREFSKQSESQFKHPPNKVTISTDSKNFTNSISFKNFQGAEKTSSSRCKMSLGQMHKYKSENQTGQLNVNVNEFSGTGHTLPFTNEGIEKRRKVGFTKKELSSLLQMKFLKKKNKTLK